MTRQMLRQHDHPGLGKLRAQQQRRPQPVVGAAWRHADVVHDNVGTVVQRRRDEPIRVALGGHDVEAGSREQEGQALS
jgi:hypothetical protein